MRDLAELRPYYGRVEQLAAAVASVLDDGPGRGLRTVEVRCWGGLAGTVLVDRALDLGQVWAESAPLAWLSGIGPVHPAYFGDDTDGAWLRRFGGGLLTTAGLVNAGPGGDYDGETYGLHGRVSALPAGDVHTSVADTPDGPRAIVSGSVREATIYGPDLLLERQWVFHVGAPVLELHDVVTNVGWRPAPLLVLYHVNLGYPLVAETAHIATNSTSRRPILGTPAVVADEWSVLRAPTPDAPVDVLLHDLPARETGWVHVTNPSAPGGPLSLRISWPSDQLPRFGHWRMMRSGTYVLGIEPTTSHLQGVAAERASGIARMLEPGEQASFDLTFNATV